MIDLLTKFQSVYECLFFTWCRRVACLLVQRSKGDGQAGRQAWPLMATEECVGLVWNVNERSRI